MDSLGINLHASIFKSLEGSCFQGCEVNGLPVGVPFRSTFSIPKQKLGLFSENVFTFIIIPVSKPKVIQSFDVEPENQSYCNTSNVKIELSTTDADHEIPNNCELSGNDKCQSDKQIEKNLRKQTASDSKLVQSIDPETVDQSEINLSKVKIELPTIDTDHEIQNKCELSGKGPGVQTEKQIKTQSRKRKAPDHSIESNYIKEKVNDSENSDSTTRRSCRIKAAGCRPDYQNMVGNITESDIGTTTDKEDFESSASKKVKGHRVNVKIGCNQDTEKDLDFDFIEDNSADEENESNEGLESDFDYKVNDLVVEKKKDNQKFENDDEQFSDEVDNNQKKTTRKAIKIRLEDHTDKYKEEIIQSYARKDRGKAFEDTSLKLFTCTICEQFKTKDQAVLEIHIEKHINGKLNCDKCDYVAAYIAALNKHKRTEHKRNMGICPKCGKEVARGNDGLRNHLGKEHNSPQWKCPKCIKKGIFNHFKTNLLMRAHIRKDHSETCVTCTGCERLFIYEVNLLQHIQSGCQGKVPPKSYPCEICGKSLTSPMLVARHIERVHKKIRSFPCPHCSYTSATGAGLARHLHTHSGS